MVDRHRPPFAPVPLQGYPRRQPHRGRGGKTLLVNEKKTVRADGAARASSASAPPAQLRTVMAGALLAMTLAALDQNIVNTALPRMVSDLGGMTHIAWVVTAFMLTSTTTTPLYGKLSDMYGRRPLFFVAITVFLAGSLLCGAARARPRRQEARLDRHVVSYARGSSIPSRSACSFSPSTRTKAVLITRPLNRKQPVSAVR
jgi:hypothetical protein